MNNYDAMAKPLPKTVYVWRRSGGYLGIAEEGENTNLDDGEVIGVYVLNGTGVVRFSVEAK